MDTEKTFLAQSDIILGSPEGQELYRLAAIKANLRLEKVGVNKTDRTRRKVAAEFGLKPSQSYDIFIEEVMKRIHDVREDILNKSLLVESIGIGLTRVMSCDRAALISNLGETYRVSFDTNNPATGTKDVILVEKEEDALLAAKAWVLEVR